MLVDTIYLDYNASTPTDPRVLKKMLPFFTECFGNASSKSHCYGWHAERAVDDARMQVLELIGAKSPDEIVFTSGATESNNLALRGIIEATKGKHIITSAIEHPCILNTCDSLSTKGVEVTKVRADKTGLISAQEVESHIRPDTALISIMAVNHEIGTIQPIDEIAEIANHHNIPFHCDAAQAVGKIPFDVHRQGIDLLSLSAHKIYGPKGVGALYLRRQPRKVELTTQTSGGGQERGLRAGTLNVPGIVGLGEACSIARDEFSHNNGRAHSLRALFLHLLNQQTQNFHIHGSMDKRVSGNLNLALGDVPAEKLINAVKYVAISGGSACSSGKDNGSPVLRAMGYEESQAARAIRIGISHLTTESEIQSACQIILENAFRLGLR